MGFLKFISAFGTVGLTASNAAIVFQRLVKHNCIRDNYDNEGEEYTTLAIIAVAELAQGSKPTSNTKKSAILNEFEKARYKSLIYYTCICLKHESNAKNIPIKTWDVWVEVIDQKLTKRGVPKQLRYGFGVETRESMMLRFLSQYPEFSRS
jgi:hypothetical protein